MADQDSVHGGGRMFRQRVELPSHISSPVSGNDWTPTDEPVDSMSPHRRAYGGGEDVEEDSETEVGTISSAAQRRRRRRQQLQQKRPPPAVPDLPSAEPELPPSSTQHQHPRTRTSSLARTPTSMSMRTAGGSVPVPGLNRSQTAPHRWPSHIYEEEADNSRSDSRRSGSRRDVSPLYRSMAGSRGSSRTSLSESDVDTDVTTSTPDEIRDIRKGGRLVQSRNAAPPTAPPPPRVPKPPTRREEVIYEEDGDGQHRRSKSRGPRRAETVYEGDFDVARGEHKRSKSRQGRAETVYDLDVDMARIKHRMRSKSRPRPVEPQYEVDIDMDRELRAKPRRGEVVYEEDLDRDRGHRQPRSRPRQQEPIYEDADDDHRRSKSKPRRAETVYELDMEDIDNHRRSKSKPRRAETVYDLDMDDMEPEGAPEPPTRPRRGEVIYEEDTEMMASKHNPFLVERARSRSRPAPARSEKHRSSGKDLRRRSSVDEARSRSHSRSNRLTGRHYESDVAYRDSRPSSARKTSHTTVGSNVTSSQSVGSSARRSSSFLGHFFGPALQVHGQDRPVKLVDCVVCMEEIPSHKIAKLKCGHRMCTSCLKDVFRMSIRDPQLMPPKCCTADHIPLKHVDRLFDTNFKRTWNKKYAEFSTRNRIYCPSRRCGEWIKPENIHRDVDGRKVAQCGRCHTKVCYKCNGKWHRSRDCPRDEETNQFLQQAKQLGWQRCHRCKAVVELKEGCNHMTCRCGAEFCMICGVKWKGCDCPWFNHDAVESDGLDDMQIPMTLRQEPTSIRSRYGSRPPSPSEFRSGGSIAMGASVRQRPQNYEEEMLLRRLQEQRDDLYARRTHNFDRYDDHDIDQDDDYRGPIQGVPKQGHHAIKDDYRRRPESVIVPPAPHTAPQGPPQYPPQANSGGPGTNYITGVHRARGVGRASSMERRLAERFNSDSRHVPTRNPSHAPPPPHLKTAATMPIMPMPMSMPPPPMAMMGGPHGHHHGSAPPGMGSMLRRHTLEEELYTNRSPRRPAVPTAPGRRQHHREEEYDDEDEVIAPTPSHRSRRRVTGRELPPSTLAGLSGPGRGMHRVHEWANYVEPGVPQEDDKMSVAMSASSLAS